MPFAFDANVAQDHFNGSLASLEALPMEELLRANVKMERAVLFCLGVHQVVSADESLRAELEGLSPRYFNLDEIEHLLRYGWALWHAIHARKRAASGAGPAISSALLLNAEDLRRQMSRVCDYHLGDIPSAAAELADIKKGKGHIDLASDLTRLAALYQSHLEILSTDARFFNPEAPAQARLLAGEIMGALTVAEGEPAIWQDRVVRLWTLLANAYSEVQAAASFVLRHDARLVHFPNLYGAIRK